MNDTKLIGRISVVTDSEVPYSNIGDVEAGFDETMLRQHIEKHGPAGLYEAISYLSFQVFEAVRELNAKKDNQQEAKQPAWVSGIDRFNAEQIIGLLQKGDKFKVIKEFVTSGNQPIHRLTDITIDTIDEDFIHTWCHIGSLFFPESFSKAEFVQLIAFGNIKQITVAPPNS